MIFDPVVSVAFSPIWALSGFEGRSTGNGDMTWIDINGDH